MRQRGWQGSPPADDAEARERVIAAAMRCIDRHGPTKTGLSDVAAELGITRQTLYRLYPSTDELFQAVSVAAADTFLDQLTARARQHTDLTEMLVECVAFTVERLGEERYLSLLLADGQITLADQHFTDPVPAELTRALFERLGVDWADLRLTRRDQDAVVEIYLRTLQSLLIDPGRRRSPRELRAFLRRWLAPSIREIMAAAQPR